MDFLSVEVATLLFSFNSLIFFSGLHFLNYFYSSEQYILNVWNVLHEPKLNMISLKINITENN